MCFFAHAIELFVPTPTSFLVGTMGHSSALGGIRGLASIRVAHETSKRDDVGSSTWKKAPSWEHNVRSFNMRDTWRRGIAGSSMQCCANLSWPWRSFRVTLPNTYCIYTPTLLKKKKTKLVFIRGRHDNDRGVKFSPRNSTSRPTKSTTAKNEPSHGGVQLWEHPAYPKDMKVFIYKKKKKN